ncbi:uncharacterized protein LOC122397051 [Colletes gigas]|uniref:uncharacterized protein LOC122397051 n=1 Tax=Colletes gigas TaxID=935657 RepID=UPI001C9AB25B|nr:uncharacterized protein LOC122397051 [Colletes gigas]
MELQKCLINYFSQLRKVDYKWKELSKEARRPLYATKNQSQQLQLIVSEDVRDGDLYKIDELRERLIYKILMGIDGELLVLLDILKPFNNITQELKSRLKNLEDARSKVSLDDVAIKELVDGTPERPRLNLLLEWAIESFNFYHELYLQINKGISQFDHKSEEMIESLIKSFAEDRFRRARIDQIFAFTQFFIKDNIS